VCGQLNRLSKDAKNPIVDIVVLDEAGQLGLGSAALVMRALKLDGQVIMAGDSEQLAPILAAQYPKTDTYLFGSILDVVMHRTKSDSERAEELSAGPRTKKKLGREDSVLTASQETTIVQLTENFR
jgi:ATP-dependent exoDNAse (exonuclease V) alpha subunit